MPQRLSLAMVVTFALVGCAGSNAPTGSPPAASLAPAAVTVTAEGGGPLPNPNAQFMPTTIDVKTGDIVRVVDVGGTEHNLTIDASGKVPSSVAAKSDQLVINVDLLNRAAQAAIDLPPGTYTFYCSIDFGSGAGHTALNGTGMVGTLTVH